MRICITGNSSRSCDRAMDDCNGCVNGGGRRAVEQLSTSELAELAYRCYLNAEDLSSITDMLVMLFKRSKLGGSNKIAFHDQLIRLNILEGNMLVSGNILYTNLLFNLIQENSREEDSA